MPGWDANCAPYWLTTDTNTGNPVCSCTATAKLRPSSVPAITQITVYILVA